MDRTMKYQRDANPEWSDRITKLPGCERVSACMQCGTCSGTCPLSIYMDLTPRRIMALLREGFRMDALRSQAIWLCASCYSCAVHCPQKISITDVMYTLKREAIQQGLYPRRFQIPILAHEFFEAVRRRGRSAELWVVLRMALRSSPGILLGMMGTGWRMFRTGRLTLRREKIRGFRGLRAALSGPREVI